MSDAFLAQVPDVRPGLYKKRKIEDRKKPLNVGKGKARPFNKKEHVQQKVHLNAKEKLVEGLKTTCLTEDNPGMKMMRMMGYNPGTGLGKEGEGIAEPIVVDPYKEKLAGLGKETAELERANKRARYELERVQAYKINEEAMVENYRKEMINKGKKGMKKKKSKIDLGLGQVDPDDLALIAPPQKPNQKKMSNEVKKKRKALLKTFNSLTTEETFSIPGSTAVFNIPVFTPAQKKKCMVSSSIPGHSCSEHCKSNTMIQPDLSHIPQSNTMIVKGKASKKQKKRKNKLLRGDHVPGLRERDVPIDPVLAQKKQLMAASSTVRSNPLGSLPVYPVLTEAQKEKLRGICGY